MKNGRLPSEEPLGRARQVRREVDDELRDYLMRRVEELRAEGYSESEAKSRAAERFGDTEEIRGECKAIQLRIRKRDGRQMMIGSLTRSLRLALRALGRRPG